MHLHTLTGQTKSTGGASAANETRDTKTELEHQPAVFTNLRARDSYATIQASGPDASGTTGSGGNSEPQKTLTLARVLDALDLKSAAEREALQAEISRMHLHSDTIELEVESMPELRRERGRETFPNLPQYRRVRFTPVTDPVSAVVSVLVTEHDVSDLKTALQELKVSREQTSRLLYSMLPEYVADHLCAGRRVRERFHPEVSIFFADIVGFTSICSQSTPGHICQMLDELYTVMDAVSSHFGIHKIETIGDCYMAAGGLFQDSDDGRRRDACRTVDMAFAMVVASSLVRVPPRRSNSFLGRLKLVETSSSLLHSGHIQHSPGADARRLSEDTDVGLEGFASPTAGVGEAVEARETVRLRVGIHTGEVASGVVGIHLPRFKLFGENVCVAARLEAAGAPSRVHCSSETAEILQAQGYAVEARGTLELKGLDDRETYWVLAVPPDVQAAVDEAVELARVHLQALRDFKGQLSADSTYSGTGRTPSDASTSSPPDAPSSRRGESPRGGGGGGGGTAAVEGAGALWRGAHSFKVGYREQALSRLQDEEDIPTERPGRYVWGHWLGNLSANRR